MNSVESQIVESYVAGKTSMRDVAALCGTDHHRVKRVLEKNNVEIVKAKRRPFTDSHRAKIGEKSKGREPWSKGKKMPIEALYKNMASHLRFDVTHEWLSQFKDIEKLKFLNGAISKRKARFDVSSEWYVEYIEKFYSDKQFCAIYEKWISEGKGAYYRPSIDHITPRSKGGNNDIGNLQFLSWFENRAKNDMTQDEWNQIKSNLGDYLV